MKNLNKEVNHLASLAVFRELYDSNKDVYKIISEFIKDAILSNAIHKFTLNEITDIINETYDFTIPDAVIKTSLNKLDFISKQHGEYIVDNLASIKANSISKIQDENKQKNDIIVTQLIEYIESQTEKKLDSRQKEKTIHSFYSFILNNSNGDYNSKFISSFFIQRKNDTDFIKSISTIKEGVLLYSGIKFNSNFNDIGSWKNELTIFISTDIIFNLAGYDGEIHKLLFEDFYKFVFEINKSANSELIKLRYFSDVEEDIFRYFKKAEDIVKGKDRLNPSKTAMSTIVKGCKTPSDIIEKKSQLYDTLKSHNIIKDNYDEYFEEYNHQYNISNLDVIEKITNDKDANKISELIKYLNYIKIRRKNHSDKNFEQIRYILLSRNSKTLKIAWHDDIKGHGEVPLATDLSFLTNKFWYKLNKGFGTNSNLVSFDIITKAQIILSSQINNSISKKFDELTLKANNGELTKEQAIASIAHLRQSVRKPEDIVKEDLQNILDTISEESIETHLKEQVHFKKRAKEGYIENLTLKSNLSEKDKEVIKYVNKNDMLNLELLNAKKELLKEKNSSIKTIEAYKINLDKEVSNNIFWLKSRIWFLLLFSFFITNFAIVKFGWNILEQWTWILSFLVPLFLSFSYSLFTEKTINLFSILNNMKLKIKEKKYTNVNFKPEVLEKLYSERDEIIEEVSSIEIISQ